MSALIEIKNLTKSFTSSQNTVTVLKNVNLSINSGEIYGIIGLSGAGKSTLIRCMNFLEVPTGGQVIFDGNDLGQMTERELRKARQSMGMIFQQFQLLAQRNVLQNVCFPLELQGMDKKKREEKARELLKIVDLADKEKAYPSQLSGGQKQRVAIARALATEPKVILCDEATSALDVSIQKNIIELLVKLQKERDLCIVFICHDIALIEQCAHQIAVMYLRNVVEVLPGGQLSKDAVHPYTRALMGSVFDINMDFSKSIENLEGEAPSPLELPEGCSFQGRCTKCMAICKKEAPQMVSLTPDHQVACHLYTESVQK